MLGGGGSATVLLFGGGSAAAGSDVILAGSGLNGCEFLCGGCSSSVVLSTIKIIYPPTLPI